MVQMKVLVKPEGLSSILETRGGKFYHPPPESCFREVLFWNLLDYVSDLQQQIQAIPQQEPPPHPAILGLFGYQLQKGVLSSAHTRMHTRVCEHTYTCMHTSCLRI